MSHSTQTLLLVDLFFIHLQIYVFLLLDVNTGSNLLYLICKQGKSRLSKLQYMQTFQQYMQAFQLC